jgi:hydrogenase maturation protein HypF
MERRVITVRGIVQGVGFRPFVYNLATRLQLKGFVKNQTGSLRIEVEGELRSIETFLTELKDRPPPLALIEGLTSENLPAVNHLQFQIVSSDSESSSQIYISPDVAVCADCLREVLNPADRRFGYPFLNCTNCGPRLTIITGAPYDRPKTTMASFPMCPACRAEYHDPADRRFHAQPTACAACGPALQLLDAQGQRLATETPLATFANALAAGKIGALKGLGGYHLACDAGSASTVVELRRRKHRDEKPFAVMVPDVASARALCDVDEVECRLLASPRCPIVLLKKRPQGDLADEIAPGNPCLGVMLPYTPLHHLLLRVLNGMPLVMTSGNRSDEPIAYEDDEATRNLAGIADLFLIHNRPIHVRCDDSVTRVVDEQELPIRRSRGYAPRPIPLPTECLRPILAVGGQLKGVFALCHGRQAFLSHHLGDLEHYAAYRAFVRDVDLYQELFAIRPEILVHDMHPDYATTRYALERSDRHGNEVLPVQHHHAHMASCMAENGLDEPVIGVTFDGTGFGTDGAIWGGEFLVGGYQQFRRAAHLRYVGLPGGDRAVREPWRMAMSYLVDAEKEEHALAARISLAQQRTIRLMLERRLNTPLTSSAGRLFDAVASLAGVRDRVSYEGQAAIELEGLASVVAPAGTYPFAIDETRVESADESQLVVDTRPLIRAVAEDADRGTAAEIVARRFHSTLVEIIARVCGRVRTATGLEAVTLSGGVFLNALLTRESCSRLRDEGFRVYRHRLVPPNDGGLSLGQLAVAAARSANGSDRKGGNDVSRDSRQGGDDLPRA